MSLVSSVYPRIKDYHLYTMTGCCVCTKQNPCTKLHGIVSNVNSVENKRTIGWNHAFCLTERANFAGCSAPPHQSQKLDQAVNALLKSAIAYLWLSPIALPSSHQQFSQHVGSSPKFTCRLAVAGRSKNSQRFDVLQDCQRGI